MSFAMFQMENIGVKCRPVGFACQIPFVTPFVDLFSNLLHAGPDRAGATGRAGERGAAKLVTRRAAACASTVIRRPMARSLQRRDHAMHG
jgi:hypothetical protein